MFVCSDEIERDGRERRELRKPRRCRGCRVLRRSYLWPSEEVPQPLAMG